MILLFLISLLLLSLSGCHKTSQKKEYYGDFYANDCGVSHGGFEWAGGYEASLVVHGDEGTLEITFIIGLGDYLTKHSYSVNDFVEAGGHMSFKVEGRTASLVLIENDQIWGGKYNNHFSGNNSDEPSERIGWLPVEVFKGYRSHYYVDLRLKSLESSSPFFLLH
jgi:hypothetical protein